jgi:8-oxo-dGTP pyrophosphatase MutT (NUDIX family)
MFPFAALEPVPLRPPAPPREGRPPAVGKCRPAWVGVVRLRDAHGGRAAALARRLIGTPPPLPPGRPAAVLASLWPDPSGAGPASLLFIRRADRGGVHDGQWALPGGSWEAPDGDLLGTALREAHEEVGLAPDRCLPLGYLPPVAIPISGYTVLAAVAWVADGERADLRPSAAEVAEVRFAPLDQLRSVRTWQRRDRGGRLGAWPVFPLDGARVWGATAMLTLSLLRRLPRSEGGLVPG